MCRAGGVRPDSKFNSGVRQVGKEMVGHGDTSASVAGPKAGLVLLVLCSISHHGVEDRTKRGYSVPSFQTLRGPWIQSQCFLCFCF